MSLVQELFEHTPYNDAIAFLQTKGIKVKEYDHFIMLNYDQIESPKTDPYVIECRSLIIDKHQGTHASVSYPRFFNLGEAPDTVIGFDFSNASVMEKADGSLIKLWYNHYDGRWEWSTRGSAFAEAPNDFHGTFRDAILNEVLELSEDEFQKIAYGALDRSVTYVFEYISKTNRIVTRYDQPQLVLITMIDNHSRVEFNDFETLVAWEHSLKTNGFKNIRTVKFFPLKSEEAIVEATKNLQDLEEGFVVLCHTTGKRIKVKSLAYLTAHKIRGEGKPTPKNIAILVAENEQDEFLAYFPEFQDLFDPIIKQMGIIREVAETTFDMFKDITDRKEYALKVKDMPISSLLFTMKNKNVTFAEAWATASESLKVSLLTGER